MRTTYYHVCFLEYNSKKGLNGPTIRSIKIFQKRKIIDNFCIHHARDDWDNNVLAKLIEVFTDPDEANKFKDEIKKWNPEEIIKYRSYRLEELIDCGLVKIFNEDRV